MATRAAEQRRIPAGERRALILRAAGRAVRARRLRGHPARGHRRGRARDEADRLSPLRLEEGALHGAARAARGGPAGLHRGDRSGRPDARPARAGDPRALVRLRPREPARVADALPRPLRRRGDPGAAAAREPARPRGDRGLHRGATPTGASRPSRSSPRPKRSRTASPASRSGGSTIRMSRRACRSTSARGS